MLGRKFERLGHTPWSCALLRSFDCWTWEYLLCWSTSHDFHPGSSSAESFSFEREIETSFLEMKEGSWTANPWTWIVQSSGSGATQTLSFLMARKASTILLLIALLVFLPLLPLFSLSPLREEPQRKKFSTGIYGWTPVLEPKNGPFWGPPPDHIFNKNSSKCPFSSFIL